MRGRLLEFGMRQLYSGLLYVLLPVFLLRLLWRSRRNPAYRQHLGERFFVGRSREPVPRIWIHAVSLGEVVGIAPIVAGLQKQHPDFRILITTTTPTGRAEILRRYGTRVEHQYLPLDLPVLMQRLVARIDADVLLLFETELWPNLIVAAKRHGTHLMLINARLSERSFRSYQRLGPLTRGMLQRLDAVAARDRTDGQRYRALGVPPDRLRVCGNVKFDQRFDQPSAAPGTNALPDRGHPARPTWIAASTHRGEDELICAAQRELLKRFPDLLLILVPRHPERFDAVARLCTEQGFRVLRRSEGRAPDPAVQVWLGDSTGELPRWFGQADLAFVGGSLVASGGHNPLEPAAHGIPILTGPHVHHFEEIYGELLARGGARVVRNPDDLARTVETLLDHPEQCREMGTRALEVLQDNRGASACIGDWLEELLSSRDRNSPEPVQTS